MLSRTAAGTPSLVRATGSWRSSISRMRRKVLQQGVFDHPCSCPSRPSHESVQTSLGLVRDVSGHLRCGHCVSPRFVYILHLADLVAGDSFGLVGGVEYENVAGIGYDESSPEEEAHRRRSGERPSDRPARDETPTSKSGKE